MLRMYETMAIYSPSLATVVEDCHAFPYQDRGEHQWQPGPGAYEDARRKGMRQCTVYSLPFSSVFPPVKKHIIHKFVVAPKRLCYIRFCHFQAVIIPLCMEDRQ